MSKERTISGGLRQGLEKARGIRRVAGGGHSRTGAYVHRSPNNLREGEQVGAPATLTAGDEGPGLCKPSPDPRTAQPGPEPTDQEV